MEPALFNDVLTVCMKCAGQEDRMSSVRVQLALVISSPLQRKELNVRLTEDDDPFFLFNLILGEEDFQSLKVQQGLLVDFAAFPKKLIELLQRCTEEQTKASPKFVLQLLRTEPTNQSLAELSIVETNPFKYLTHLSLKLQPGDDADIKKYLASCLTSLQAKHGKLSERSKSVETSLSSQLQESHKVLATRDQELERLRSEWSVHTETMEAKHKQELSDERRQALQNQRELDQRFDREKTELNNMRRQSSSDSQARLLELQTANKDLTDRKYRLESTNRELIAKLNAVDEDYHRAKEELQSLRQQRGDLESDQRGNEATIGQQKTRLAVLQQELADKETVLSQNKELLQVAQQQKARLEESVQQKSSLVVKLETTVKATSHEVMKGNEIIKKLQGELKAALAKLKLKNTVTSKQEKILEEKNQTVRSLQQEMDSFKMAKQQLEHQNGHLNESLETTKTKLEESQQLLKTNENVINWLNKQVNEAQLMSKRQRLLEVPTSTVAYRPSAIPVFRPPNQHAWPMSSTQLTPAVSAIPPHSTPLGYNSSAMSLPSMPRQEPALDPKYLQRPSQNAAMADVPAPRPSRPVPIQLSSTPAGGPQLTPQGGPAPPPLMSAYFPTQLKGTT